MKEKIENYVPIVILFILVFSILFSASYTNLNGLGNITTIAIDKTSLNFEKEILTENNLHYLSYEDMKNTFGDNVEFDDANKRVIFTTSNGIGVYEKDSFISYENMEAKESNICNLIFRDGTYYFSINKICEELSYILKENTNTRELNIVANEMKAAVLNSKRAYAYQDLDNKKRRYLIDNSSEIQIVTNFDYYDKDSKWCMIVCNNEFVGYIPKINISFEEGIETQNSKEQDFKEFSYSNKIMDSAKGVLYNGIKLVDNSGNISVENISKNIDNSQDNYVILTNGYGVSNYDNSITSHILQNSIARLALVKNAIDKIVDTENTFCGIAIDFRDFSVNNKEYFTQFVKEATSYAHSKQKRVMVYIPLNANYIDIKNVLKYADYAIILQHGDKTINSKISGPDSPIRVIESKITEFKENEYAMNKIIFEIPTSCIIWIEKDQKVISAERVDYSYIKQILRNNNLKTVVDSKYNQNYVEYLKGELTYKIWLEDDYNIKNKIDLFKISECAGFLKY